MEMKKIVMPLVCSLLLFVIGAYALWKNFPLGHEQRQTHEKTVENRRPESGDEIFSTDKGRSPGKYTELYDKYSTGALSGDPVSIDKFIRLEGACESGVSVIPGVEIPVEVKRLRDFCAMHYSSKEEFDYRVNVLRKQSYSAKLEARLRKVEEVAGKDVARRELSAELRSANADQAQMILEYASNADLVPEELSSEADIRADPSLAEKLSILSYIEFCRRGGECGDSDFPALAACVSLPPCSSKFGLLEVIRRASAPRDYEAAQSMSEMLHGRR